jgi:hypothetical protein
VKITKSQEVRRGSRGFFGPTTDGLVTQVGRNDWLLAVDGATVTAPHGGERLFGSKILMSPPRGLGLAVRGPVVFI